MTRKRSFTIVVNLETESDETDVDLGEAEDETYYAVTRALEDFPSDTGETRWGVAYVSREGEPAEWTEPGE